MNVYEAVSIDRKISDFSMTNWGLRSLCYNWSKLDFLNPDFDFHKVWSIAELSLCLEQLELILEEMQG